MAKPMPWRRRSTVAEAGDTDLGTDLPHTAAHPDDDEPPGTAPGRRRVADATPLLLLRAAHAKQGVLTAVGLAAAAAISGRPAREAGVVLATVLVGQTILGWHNDLVDRERDRRHDLPGKPIAQGLLDPGTAWFALLCAVLLVVPLSVATGVTAGLCYLVSLAIGMLGNLVLRRGLLSWLPWAASYALYPAYLSYGGWGGADTGSAPEPVMVVLAAFLGIGVHLLVSLWGLVPDNADGWRSLPLRLGLRLGASRLLTVATVYLLLVLGALGVVGIQVGLAR
ncbi:UbiA family prenyltransferase [Nocardioides ochotonae]|uniref:UbiA family prenyltransferase n=1 Tax=Nocardioides ochotonae TaxID=2685869 RepID=UPI00140C7B4A|nr:UbiA family prenyltransferase [Nocardioides ochotonae]